MKYICLRKMLEKSPCKIEEIAEAIGITSKELRDKLDGKTPLFVYDVYVICNVLNIKSTKEKLKLFYPERPKSGTRKGARST